MTQPTLQQQTLAQVTALMDAVHALDKKLDALTYQINAVAELSQKHERVLYRKNGDPGLLEMFDDLAQEVREHHRKAQDEVMLVKQRQEKSAEEKRKLLYGLVASVVVMILNILVSILGVSR